MGKKGKQEAEFKETALSKQQFKILQDRERFFQDFSQPALEQFFNEAQDFNLSDDFRTTSVTDLLRGPAAQIGDQFNFQEEQLQSGLAQRGLSGSGIEASALAQLGAQKQSALRNAASQALQGAAASQDARRDLLNQNMLAEQGVQSSALGQLLSLAPKPTTAAPTATVQTESGGSGLGSAIGGALGGAAGFAMGGPMGGAAGSQAGSNLGGMF
jgi:hypothetical protein